MTASEGSIQYVYKVADTLKAPVHKGAVAGSLEVYLDDELIDVENVIVSEEIADVTFKDEIIKFYIVLQCNICLAQAYPKLSII